MPFTNKCEAKKAERLKLKKEQKNVRMSQTIGVRVI